MYSQEPVQSTLTHPVSFGLCPLPDEVSRLCHSLHPILLYEYDLQMVLGMTGT